MAKKIIWSKAAVESFNEVIIYLQDNWSEREVIRFVKFTSNVLNIINSGMVKFRVSEGRKNVHEVLITKHNLLVYREKKDRIELVLFFDTRQQPIKKRK